MALNINGRMKVKTLKTDFKKEFGLTLRVYDGRSFADEDATLASIRKGDSKGGEFSPRRNTKVGNLEDKIQELFGIKTQVAGSDDSYLCDNDKTLAGALEADEKLMVKREKRIKEDVAGEEKSSTAGKEDLAATEVPKEDTQKHEEIPAGSVSDDRIVAEETKKDVGILENTVESTGGDKSFIARIIQTLAEKIKAMYRS